MPYPLERDKQMCLPQCFSAELFPSCSEDNPLDITHLIKFLPFPGLRSQSLLGLPGIASQINYLHSDLCLWVCFRVYLRWGFQGPERGRDLPGVTRLLCVEPWPKLRAGGVRGVHRRRRSIRLSLVLASGSHSLVAVHSPLIAVASLLAEHRL